MPNNIPLTEEQKTQLYRSLYTLYQNLKDSPEKGTNNISFVAWTAPKGVPGSAGYIAGFYSPTQTEFVDTLTAQYKESSQTIQQFIVDTYKYYGYGPKIKIKEEGADTTAEKWHLQTKTFLSKDKKYYIVPVVYKKIVDNPAIKQFFTNPSDTLSKDSKLQIYGNKEEPGHGILGDAPASKIFRNSAKVWALEKLASDLAKSINQDHRKEAETMGFLPVDSKNVDNNNAEMAEAWYIDARPPEYQNLFLKIMFDKGWVDAIPPQLSPCVDLPSSRTVMIFIKSFQQDLNNLEQILWKFNDRIISSKVQMPFDAACTAGKVPKIPELINYLLRLNGKPEIDDKSNAALQFGFTEELELQYIAYSEEPECLCDDTNINAYILQKGIEDLKKTPPFDSPTNNGFLFYLPEIMRKYVPYLNGPKSKFLFSAQESWIRFANSFVYPKPEIVHDTSESAADHFAKQMAAIEKVTKSGFNVLKDAAYLQDPTMIMNSDIRNLIQGATSSQVVFAGDDVMMKAIKSDILNLTSLYGRLLHKVPITELVKLAVAAIVKCTSDSALKKKLCRTLIKTMPRIEIETKIYPCLRDGGHEGAIASLQSAIGGRESKVYEQARARHPEKFPASEGMKTEAEMAAVNDFYCNDPALQNALGRSPDDMSEELLAWLEGEYASAVCDCILTVYGPVQKIIQFVEEAKDEVSDVVDILGKNKAQSAEGQSTFSFDRYIAPCKKTEDRIQSFGDELQKGLEKMVLDIMLAAVLVVLNQVKSSIMGGLLRDVCNAAKSPWKLLDITDEIMNSPLHVDTTFLDLKKKIGNIGKLAGLSADINDLIDGINALSSEFSPSEMKRLFFTECGDNSFDAGFQSVADSMAKNHNVTIEGQNPEVATNNIFNDHTPTGAALTAQESMTLTNLEDPEAAPLNIPPACPAAPVNSPGPYHDLLSGIGGLMSPDVFDEAIDAWERAKSEFVDLCDPDTPNVLGDNVSEGDIRKLAEYDQNKMLDEITTMLPLLDPSKLEDMMPPLFCGPCDPGKVGQEPLMPSQTHPSQLFLLDRMNKNLFKMVNKMFNNNISAYKPIIMDVREDAKQYPEIYKELAEKHMPTKKELKKMTDVEKSEAFSDAHKLIQTEMMSRFAAEDGDGTSQKDKFVAKALLDALESAAAQSEVNPNQNIIINPESRVFSYDIPDSANQILMIINFSNSASTYGSITTESRQIKIAVQNKFSKTIEYEWPNPKSTELHQIKDFNELDLTMEFFRHLGEKIPAMNSLLGLEVVTQTITGGKQASVLTQHYPLIVNLIFETVFTQAAQHDLFRSNIFYQVPLTDEEVKKRCKEGPGKKPLLDTAKLADDVSKAREALECVIGMFETPDATQVAQMFGLYKLIIKVCIIEEFLKNIFIFGFVRIADILESDIYMPILLKNIVGVIQSSVNGDNYDNLLDYSAKIINGREILGEEFKSVGPADEWATGPFGPMKKMKTPEECLMIIIRETAREVNDILDDRIQGLLDPGWTKKFFAYDSVDDPETQSVLESRLLEYAILSPDYWSPNVYPRPHHGLSPTLGKLDAMNPILETEPDRGLTVYSDANGATIFKGGWPTAPTNVTQFETDRAFNAVSYWPTIGNQPWGGGLFLQPYMKITSKLSGPSGPGSFWTKFKKAYELKKEFETNPTSAAFAAQYTKSSDPNNVGENAVALLISKMDDNSLTQDARALLFNSFFKTFFDPTYLPDAKAKMPFTRLVSSQVTSAETADTSYEPYYYWDDNLDNAIQGAQERYHWLNRGIISTDFALDVAQRAEQKAQNLALAEEIALQAAYANMISGIVLAPGESLSSRKKEIHSYIYSNRKHFYPPHINPSNSFGNLNAVPAKAFPEGMMLSTINLLGLAKDMSPITNLKPSTTTSAFFDSVRNFLGTNGAGSLQTTDQYPIDKDGAGGFESPVHDYTEAVAFWSRVRDIIFDSPYDLWFDFTLGMRLNLVFPIDSEEAQQGIFEAAQFQMDKEDFAKYKKEKMFIWEKSVDERFLCLPLESVEHDLTYIENEIWNGWGPVYTALNDINTWTSPLFGTQSTLGIVTTPGDSGAPSLWSITRAMSAGLYQDKDKVLGLLKKELMQKMLAPGPEQEPNKFLNEILPVKELVVTTALMFRYYMEGAYPSLNQLFDPTKKTLNRYIKQLAATIDGDYQYVDDLTEESDPNADLGTSPTAEEIVKKFFMLVVQMAANMTDPTWKTPWFLPGPITPWGIIAKLLNTKWSEDETAGDSDLLKLLEECPAIPVSYGESEEEAVEEILLPTAPMIDPVIQEQLNKWAQDKADGFPPPTYDGFVFSPFPYSEGIQFRYRDGVVKNNKTLLKLPFWENKWRHPIYVPYVYLTDEAKKRQWEFFQARHFGFPAPPPFYNKFNVLSWAVATDDITIDQSNNATYPNLASTTHPRYKKSWDGILRGVKNADFAEMAAGTIQPASWAQVCSWYNPCVSDTPRSGLAYTDECSWPNVQHPPRRNFPAWGGSVTSLGVSNPELVPFVHGKNLTWNPAPGAVVWVSPTDPDKVMFAPPAQPLTNTQTHPETGGVVPYTETGYNQAWYYYLYGYAGGTYDTFGHKGENYKYTDNWWQWPNLFGPPNWSPTWKGPDIHTQIYVSWYQSQIVEYQIVKEGAVEHLKGLAQEVIDTGYITAGMAATWKNF